MSIPFILVLFNRYNELFYIICTHAAVNETQCHNILSFNCIGRRKNVLFNLHILDFSQIYHSVEMIFCMVSAHVEVNCVKSNETHHSRK